MSPPKKKLLHLQGIRGLAILFVVLFHFFPTQFSNGYVGVDMFFLLSGYLMTMMLCSQKSLGVGEIVDFLYRRVKRITPLYYLAVVGILVSLRTASVSVRAANVQPAELALAFATNLVKPNGMVGYFEKLGVAVDMFTHTWSLALEMQFYLLFPFIFITYKLLPERISTFYIYLLSLISFVFYFSADPFTSFNSVFARIWQFNAGMISYLAANKDIKADLQESLMEEKDVLLSRRDQESSPAMLNYCLAAVLALTLSPSAVYPHFARLNTTVLTMMVLQFGSRSVVLENRPLVFIGEVSFAWYLVHWPFVAQSRLLGVDSIIHLSAAILTSFLIAVILHFLFERKYLKWEKSAIFSVLVFLIIANVAEVVLMKETIPKMEIEAANLSPIIRQGETNKTVSFFNYPSDFPGKIIYGHENKTKSDLVKLNNAYQASDLKRTLESFCKKFKKTSNPKESRCEMNEGANKTSTMKLLVVGNSFASNLMAVIANECQHKFNHLEISFMGACEAFVRTTSSTYYDCSYDYMYADAAKEVKPDVLFIIERHFQLKEILNGTNPFDDANFRMASERLNELQKHVKKRIFILDAHPDVSSDTSKHMNNHLSKNTAIKDTSTWSISGGYMTARMRLARLVEKCPKCQLFDYATQMFFNGIYKPYDPEHFISFFTKGQHLTPAGWERVRPLVRHMCDSV